MSKSESTTYVPCPAGKSCRFGSSRHEEGSSKLDACRRAVRLGGRSSGASVSVTPPRAIPDPDLRARAARGVRGVREVLVGVARGEDSSATVEVAEGDALAVLDAVLTLVDDGRASEAVASAHGRLASAVLEGREGSVTLRVDDAVELARALPVTVTPEVAREAVLLPGGVVAETPDGEVLATGDAFLREADAPSTEGNRVLLGTLAIRTLRARAASEVSGDRVWERTAELVSEAIEARRSPRPPRAAVSGSREGVDLDPAVVRRASGSVESSIIVSERRGVEVAPSHVLVERPGYEVLASRDRVRAHVGRADIAALAARSRSGGVADGPTDRPGVYEAAARTLSAEVSALRALVVPLGGGGRDGYPRDWPDGAPEAELERLDREVALARGALDDLDRAYENEALGSSVDFTTSDLWDSLRAKDEASTRRRREVAYEVSRRR